MNESARESYEVVIGLEIHVQLNTRSKIFSTDPVDFGATPNSLVNEVTLAHPGTLPRLNREVVSMGIRMALACEGTISPLQHFDRKNYFYPDLPKGYQITQDRSPLCRGGRIAVPSRNGIFYVDLEKIHMEEDAGKSIHTGNDEDSHVDFNRAGVPLLEVVTKPVITNAEDAAATLGEVRKLVRYLGISDGNMEEGSLRCDANVSIKPKGTHALGRKVEIKNLNSLRNLTHAIRSDVDRQIGLATTGQPIHSETRGFDVESGSTYSLRTKEELNDYRYFPDPDLPTISITSAWLEEVKQFMPVLPSAWFERLTSTYGLSTTDALTLTDTRETSEYFEALCNHGVRHKAAANWLIGPAKSVMNEKGWSQHEWPVSAAKLASLIQLVEEGLVSFSSAAQRLLPLLIEKPGGEPKVLAQELGIVQDRDTGELERVIAEVIREFPLKVEEYRNGKKGIVAMFMGEVMRRTQGKADARRASEVIIAKLEKK
jgi:aspartyl-tRNA(Asn)/glutamyl-tRNA(Gln) amidotransferase subunit B